MPYIGQTIPGAFDTQASSPDRHRRNWQVLTNLLAAGNLFTVATNGGLTNGVTGLAVQVNSTGGLTVGSSGIAALLDPAGALSSSSAGLAVKVDGSTINIVGDKLVGSAAGVTSVALAAPAAFFTVSGSPVTTTGTLTLAFPATPTLPQSTSVTFTNTSTSGTIHGLSILPTYNQASGTAANSDLFINRVQTAVGSGLQDLIQAQVGGVNKFLVTNTGAGSFASVLNVSGSITASTGNITVTTGNINALNGLIQAKTINVSGAGTSGAIQIGGSAFIDQNSNIYNLSTGTIMIDFAGHFIGTTGPPTYSAGSGAGGGPTISVAGFDTGGTISVTTGSLPSGSGATIVTVNFAFAYSAAPSAVILTPANAATAALGSLTPYVGSIGTGSFALISNVTGLAGATAYKWFFQVIG